MKAIRKLNIPFLGRNNILPPNPSELSARYFSKGLTADGKEAINTKGDNAKVVQRLCAKSDGATGYITLPNGAISGVVGSDWSLSFIVTRSATSAIRLLFGTFDTSATTERFYCYNSSGTIRLQIGQGSVQTVSPSGYMDSGKSYLVMFQFDSATKIISSKFKDLASGVVSDGVNYTVTGLLAMGNEFGVFANYNGSNPADDCIHDFKVWFSLVSFDNMQIPSYVDGVNLSLNLEGSAYDASGNAYHGTVLGTIDFDSTYTDTTNGVYSHNLNNGFDLYTAVGLDDVYVPYVNGVPIVSSVAGYTLDSEHPSGTWNNVPDCSILFTDDIMDKSNVLYWKASVRALPSYNATYPKKHDLRELTLDFFSTHMETAIINRLFVADNESNYVVPYVKVGDLYVYGSTGETLNRGQNLLMYNPSQTEPVLVRIINWIIGKGRKGI